MDKHVMFQGRGWDDYIFWQTQDKKTLKKINQLIQDVARNKHTGVGKPEPLSHDFSGFWSRRIDDTNRLVYRVNDGNIEIVQCLGHYND